MKGFDLLVDIRERFRTDPVGPFDERSRILYEQLLAPLGLDGQIAEGTRPAAVTSAPTITATWVLLVRRRSTMFRRFFTSLRDALVSQQIGVAAPLAAVVADEPSRLDLDRGEGEDRFLAATAERLLMPLPTNPEQELVAQRLAEHRGVTVQGPPGTGKTHTIANLISHLVGHGKRVLVTSQKEQALVVLRTRSPNPSGTCRWPYWEAPPPRWRSSTNPCRRSTSMPSASTGPRPGPGLLRWMPIWVSFTATSARCGPGSALPSPANETPTPSAPSPTPVDPRPVARRERRRPGIHPG